MNRKEKIEELQRIIDGSKAIVFFTGAGVSTASGIPDFRSQDGLYNQQFAYPPEEIISHHFFYDDTEEFYRFYKQKMVYPDPKPNIVHEYIAKLEKAGKCLGTVTQNIDVCIQPPDQTTSMNCTARSCAIPVNSADGAIP